MDKQIIEQLTKSVKSWVCAAEHQALREQRMTEGIATSPDVAPFQSGVIFGINLMADILISCADQLIGEEAAH